jgi:hypothetical protein
MKKAAVVLCAFAAGIASVFAQKPSVVTSHAPGWHRIGEATASFQKENESISVMGADQFSAIKLKVTDAPINIERLQVFYEDGKMEDFKVGSTLQAGSETRELTLKDPEHEIKRVEFTYKTLPNTNAEKAQVQLFGLKSKTASYRSDADNDESKVSEKARETGRDVENGVEKAGDKISETAANGAAHIKDKVYDGKQGPGGETIYIDKDSKYYYINSEGNKVYVTKLQIKDKP